MRSLVFLFLICSLHAVGQSANSDISGYVPFAGVNKIKWYIDSSDTLERQFLKYNLNCLEDTLALVTLDENQGWRDMQLVSYYFDSTFIRCILFNDGRRGSHFFFFRENKLIKVKSRRKGKIESVLFNPSEGKVSSEIFSQPRIREGILTLDKPNLISFASSFIWKFNNQLQ